MAVLAIVASVGCSSSSSSTHRQAAPPSTVQVRAGVATATVSATAAQRIDGFGASGAWWPIDLAHFPAAVQRSVGGMLFGPRGIALSGYRYNIGGGGVGVTNPTRAPQTFLVRPGVYDWSRDPGGTTFLRLAARAHVPVLTGFVNSAPTAWTTNARSCGGDLAPSGASAFGGYLADVTRHLRDREHITLSYISPMNEPDNSFPDCGQEGMRVPVEQRAAVVEAVGRALAASARWARVIADESSSAAFMFVNEVPVWMSSGDAASWVAALAHHTYEFPTDAMLAKVAPIGARFGKPMWMTEICCYDGKGPIVGFGSQYDPTMTSAMWMADTIWQDLTIAGDSAYYWWTALSSQLGCDPVASPSCVTTKRDGSGWNDGLLYYDANYARNGNHTIYTTKRYWVFGNFSRYVRPGAVRHEVTGVPAGVRILAFADRGTWTVVALNDSTTAATVNLALPTRGRSMRARRAVRTSAVENLTTISRPAATAASSFLLDLPAQSVTTFQFN